MSDRISYLAWAALGLVVALAVASVVPIRPENRIDPVGTYVGKCGENSVYKVAIKREPAGPLVSVWAEVAGGKINYVGTLTLQPGGEWQERYWPHEQLFHCRPWLWKTTSEKPLAFAGDGEWTLTAVEPDF